MRTAEDYRLNAFECLALATRQADPHAGYILRGVADSWFMLAEQAARVETRPETKPAS